MLASNVRTQRLYFGAIFASSGVSRRAEFPCPQALFPNLQMPGNRAFMDSAGKQPRETLAIWHRQEK
jgi:hypothetical protein